MLNNNDSHIKNAIADTIDNFLNYSDMCKIRLVANKFNIEYSDRYEYVALLDAIYAYCNLDLQHSINILNFINNDYK